MNRQKTCLMVLAAVDHLQHVRGVQALIQASDIAATLGVGKRYSEDTLQSLCRHGWLISKTSGKGGYTLSDKARKAGAINFFYETLPDRLHWMAEIMPKPKRPRRMPFRELLLFFLEERQVDRIGV